MSRSPLAVQLSKSLPKATQQLLSKATFPVRWLVGDSSNYASLILPNTSKTAEINFSNSYGYPQPEFNLTMASNGVAVNYLDPRNSKRPSDQRGFVVADHNPSSKMFLDQAFGFGRHQLQVQTERWLAPRELVIIPAKIADGKNGSALDVAYIAPKELAWAKLAWDLIHKTPSAERLYQDFKPQAIFYAIPGLRSCLFRDVQSTVFDRANDGLIYAYSDSSYMGLGMSKKPIFVMLSHQTVMQGKGWLAHGTMVVMEGKGVKKGMIYHAASGHGKTEFRYVREGKISIGELNGEKIFIDYPAASRPNIIAAGDDGVLFRDFTSGKGYGLAENSEKGGAFDRPSGSFKPGDLIENDQLFENTIGKPFSHLTLNMLASPGEPIETHPREFEANGKLHSNPRHTYTWEALAETQILKDQRVSVTTDPICFDTSIFGMGVTPQTAVISWLNQLPLCSAFTLMLAGVCRSKSVSVTDGGGHADHDLKLDRFGTMESFTINQDVDNANRLWEYFRNFTKVAHYTTPIGNVGPKVKVEENEAELLARDFLYQREVGQASAEFVPGKCPFFGLQPKNAKFLDNEIPAAYSDPSQQFTDTESFKKAASSIIDLIREGLVVLLNDPKLNPEAKLAINKALSAPIHEPNPDKARRIFADLNTIPEVFAVSQ